MCKCLVLRDVAITSGKRDHGRPFILAMNTKTSFLKLPVTFGPKFAMKHGVYEFYLNFGRHLDAPLLRFCGQFISKSDIFFENRIVRI